MSYDYQVERKELFTEDGQVLFIKIRDQVRHLLETAGAFQLSAIKMDGSSWTCLACIDRLVELGEIVECVRPNAGETWAQYRVYSTKGTNGR